MIVSWTMCGPGSAAIIGDALRSVAPIVTGATLLRTNVDDEEWGHTLDALPTREVAILAVGSIVWRADFAEARNAALSVAADTGAGWSCMLDPDERVVCPDPAALRAFLAALPASVCVVVAQSADGSHGRERFFRLPARHRFVGRTHEAFPVEPGEQASVPPSIITWDELPKDAARLRAKNERDVMMLRAEVAEHPEDARWHFYLAGALAGCDRPEEAIEAYREAMDRDHDETGAMACVRAAVLLHDAGRHEEAIAVCARGMTMRADFAELPWIAAGASYNLGALYQAEAWARIAKVHGEAGEGRGALDRRVGARGVRALRDGPDEVLALVDAKRGRVRHALAPDPNPIRITVTSTGFRAARWAPRCIGSVATQTATANHVYVAADEETFDAAWSNGRRRWTHVGWDGDGARGLLANLLPIWRALPDDEVIVWLDGDDWLAHDHALETVARMHAAGALCTWGQFITSTGDVGFCAPVAGDVRTGPWRTSHLKTFRAGLVKRIRDEDLRRADGEYLDLAIDQAVMIPCVEMAAERAVFCPQVLAVYNVEHSFAANASDAERAREVAEVARIRRMRRYERVEWTTMGGAR